MELQLKNIGMIKEANVKLDGLTVIAGENDTGKSTLSKVLFAFVQTLDTSKYIEARQKRSYDFGEIFDSYIKNIFDNQISKNGSIKIVDISDDEYHFLLTIEENKCIEFSIPEIELLDFMDYNISMVESPVIWNFMNIFTQLPPIEDRMNIDLNYPAIMKDLHFQLSVANRGNKDSIVKNIKSIIGGEFKQDTLGAFFFEKENQRIELSNTATGIKYFGILQVLSRNNYFVENDILILDEPEVHLHPKWQLKMAEVIVELVKNGVKVLVNSHSPYMIEALKRYSELAEVNSDFYLAEDGYIKKENDSNSETLAKIFEKLSEPFDVFEEMDMERLLNV